MPTGRADAVLGAALAFTISAVVIGVLLRSRSRLPQDAPNERSLHHSPLPRGGGLAIWAGWLPVALWTSSPADGGLARWLVPWAALALVSLRDDVRALGVGVRLLIHAFAACWFAASLAWPTSADIVPAMSLALACAAVAAWSLNLYNFMDGSDGLAATMAILGFGAYGVGNVVAGDSGTLYFALAAATVPFLVVNVPPSRIMMGDVGAVPMGFLAAAFGLNSVVAGGWPAWFPLLVFLPFIADATVTLARRASRGERLWRAHRTHYYQRLHQLGAGHRGTLAVYGAWMAGTGLTALACLQWQREWGWPALVAWCIAGAALFATIDYHWRVKSSAKQ